MRQIASVESVGQAERQAFFAVVEKSLRAIDDYFIEPHFDESLESIPLAAAHRLTRRYKAWGKFTECVSELARACALFGIDPKPISELPKPRSMWDMLDQQKEDPDSDLAKKKLKWRQTHDIGQRPPWMNPYAREHDHDLLTAQCAEEDQAWEKARATLDSLLEKMFESWPSQRRLLPEPPAELLEKEGMGAANKERAKPDRNVEVKKSDEVREQDRGCAELTADERKHEALKYLAEREVWGIDELPVSIHINDLRCLDRDGFIEVRTIALNNVAHNSGDTAPPVPVRSDWFSPIAEPKRAGRWDEIMAMKTRDACRYPPEIRLTEVGRSELWELTHINAEPKGKAEPPAPPIDEEKNENNGEPEDGLAASNRKLDNLPKRVRKARDQYISVCEKAELHNPTYVSVFRLMLEANREASNQKRDEPYRNLPKMDTWRRYLGIWKKATGQRKP